MFDMNDAMYAASVLGVSFDKYTPEEFLDGINIELEHGAVNSKTNVTSDDLIATAKIAVAHLNEFPNYYNKIFIHIFYYNLYLYYSSLIIYSFYYIINAVVIWQK